MLNEELKLANKLEHFTNNELKCFVKNSLTITKSFIWWQKLFFQRMKMCVINSYILYKTGKLSKNKTPHCNIYHITYGHVFNLLSKPAHSQKLQRHTWQVIGNGYAHF